MLVARLQRAEGSEPWMESLIGQANPIAGEIGRPPMTLADFAPMVGAQPSGPTAADVADAAEMDEEDRTAFIRSMVDRLAARLESQPDDLDGWMRLGNAYRVLGHPAAARDAYRRAVMLLAGQPGDDARRQIMQDALEGLGEPG
jgi:cytochrome c-type biogenesis protein CcmH